jgi:hypothetical protein
MSDELAMLMAGYACTSGYHTTQHHPFPSLRGEDEGTSASQRRQQQQQGNVLSKVSAAGRGIGLYWAQRGSRTPEPCGWILLEPRVARGKVTCFRYQPQACRLINVRYRLDSLCISATSGIDMNNNSSSNTPTTGGGRETSQARTSE